MRLTERDYYEMEFSEATKIVFSRIQTVEPDLVSKIIGYLLLKDSGDREMIRLAFGPDSAIHSLINEAKAALPTLALTSRSPPLTPTQFPPIPPFSPRTLPSLFWGADFGPHGQFPDGVNDAGGSAQMSPSLHELPAKICHYYFKGYCKHGSSCRYYHGQNGLTSADFVNEENFISLASLAKLEFELTELIRSRGGQPVPIAMLPMLYFERYGKVLEADGYLTESQRHSKAGFSLTKLLTRLKHSIRILDRPHGQHSVVLVEDAGRHLEYVAGSQQIYLTFPAESEFSEEDVSNYFKQFGPVRDVRIPCQHKRMFGFVTFENQETAQFILAQGNPHFVCGARVLVKPYKEKSRFNNKKFVVKMEHSMHHAPQFLEMESELYPMPRFCNDARSLKKQLLDKNDQVLELQNLQRLSELRLVAPRLLGQTPFSSYDVKDHKIPRDFASVDHLNGLIDEESLGLSLPDSPFASASLGNSG